MNELVEIRKELDVNGAREVFARAAEDIMNRVKNWKDFEREFIRLEGLSATTIKNITSACKQLFDYHEMLNPFYVSVGHLDEFFDRYIKKNSIRSAANRMVLIKRFYQNLVTHKAPWYKSPFERASETQLEKWKEPRQEDREKEVLWEDEIQELWKKLQKEDSRWHFYAMRLSQFLYKTGMRINEVTQLNWSSVERFRNKKKDDRWRVRFIQKGGEEATQQIPSDVLDEMRTLWIGMKGREPDPEDPLWLSPPMKTRKRKVRRLTNHQAWELFSILSKEVNQARLFDHEIKLTPHYWRHAVATNLLREHNWTTRKVQLFLRHKSSTTTEEMYAHDKAPDTEELFLQ